MPPLEVYAPPLGPDAQDQEMADKTNIQNVESQVKMVKAKTQQQNYNNIFLKH